MNEDIRNALIEAIWRALDATDGDFDGVRDEAEQAFDTWEPK